MNSDERDLIAYAERAGFRDIHLDLEVDMKPLSEIPGWNLTWESFMRSAGNPKIPTLEEATAQPLTKDEVARNAGPSDWPSPRVTCWPRRPGFVLRRRFERAMRANQ